MPTDNKKGAKRGRERQGPQKHPADVRKKNANPSTRTNNARSSSRRNPYRTTRQSDSSPVIRLTTHHLVPRAVVLDCLLHPLRESAHELVAAAVDVHDPSRRKPVAFHLVSPGVYQKVQQKEKSRQGHRNNLTVGRQKKKTKGCTRRHTRTAFFHSEGRTRRKHFTR